MKKILKRICKILVLTLFGAIGLFLTLVLVFNAIRWNDIRIQKRHIEDLEELYESGYQAIDEQSFVGFDLENDSLRLNEIRMIASHNSYKKLGTKLGKLFIGLGDSFSEARALEYGNPDLSMQLNLGIRSFELDVRLRSGEFESTHVPLVDNSSVAVKLDLAFQEIAMWSENNPEHIPIILLLEIKDDWMMLDPFLDEIGIEELGMLDDLIYESFGNTLYTPEMLKGDYASPKERLLAESWPLLQDMLGKVIVVLHPGNWTDSYVEVDLEYDDMAMFPAASNMDVDYGYVAFVVHNDPNVDEIAQLLAENLIVRTRMDSGLVINTDERVDSLASGAQIMTTDFHPAHQFKDEPFTYLDAEYLIVENDVLLSNP